MPAILAMGAPASRAAVPYQIPLKNADRPAIVKSDI
jgi:hypothetical protein